MWRSSIVPASRLRRPFVWTVLESYKFRLGLAFNLSEKTVHLVLLRSMSQVLVCIHRTSSLTRGFRHLSQTQDLVQLVFINPNHIYNDLVDETKIDGEILFNFDHPKNELLEVSLEEFEQLFGLGNP